MGMGYAGNFAVTMEEKDLAEIVPAEFKTFDNARKALGNMFEEFARQVSMDDVQNEEGIPEMLEAYNTLRTAFKDKTGIALYLGYHNQEDDGDRYDDLCGVYWSLDFSDCFPASPAFVNLKKVAKEYVGIQHFVTFG